MLRPTGRTNICTVLFMDIAGFSRRTDAVQLAAKSALARNIAEAVAAIAEGERIVLDTGDGAAICFMGDPEDALFVATAVMAGARREEGAASHKLRIGINLGPIKIVTDVGGHRNVVGDGINVAQRVMSFAEEGELLVARSYYEVIARLREGNDQLFRYLGTKTDKHVREHQVYVLAEGPGMGVRPGAAIPSPEGETVPAADPASEREAASAPKRKAAPAPKGKTAPVLEREAVPEGAPLAGSVVPDAVREAERRRLAERIGPLAEVIVRRAAASAPDIDAFYRTISAAIPDEADRADFLAGAVQRPGEAPPVAAPRADPEGPPPDEAEIAEIERRLARHIGPLAAVLVRRAAREATDRAEFLRLLAEKIPDDNRRRRFLAEVGSDR